MKRFLPTPKRFLAFFLALGLGMGTAYAYDFYKNCSTGQRLYYNIIDATNRYVEITYPVSSGCAWCGANKPTGNITLPSTVTYGGVTYTVKKIGSNAFEACDGLTGSLTIPNTVTEIEISAFADCSGFTGLLTLPSSITYIGDDTFYGCSGFTGTLTIPSSVTMIGERAFEGCSGFTGTLTIPSSVTLIGWEAFKGCTGFTGSLTIPNLVTTIGDYAFEGCTGFTGTLTIGTGVTSIGRSAFKNCSGFSMVRYGATNCADVASDAKPFEGCGGTLIIDNGVQRIPSYMFFQCSGFTGNLTIPSSVITIGEGAFRNCTGFNGSLTISDGVTTIGIDAFCNCNSFTGDLTIPNSVTTINSYAFMACRGFTGMLTIGSGVTSIGTGAFTNCTGFTGPLTIGNSVASIGNSAFYGCNNLTAMTVKPETPPTLGTNVFLNVPTNILVTVPCVSLEDYQTASGWSAFTNMQCRETLTVYEGTNTNEKIPAYIFYFDDFTKSQCIIPAADLAEMAGCTIRSMTFYTTNTNVPYTTVSSADVYLKEVDYTSIDAFVSKSSATMVYSGLFNIVSAGNGGEMTINFITPYTYHGGNLLVGIENTQDNGYKTIYFYGQTVDGASISGSNGSSTGAIPANQQNFIPKTTFSFEPSTCEPQSLPYTYGFEDAGEFGCWTMLACSDNSAITISPYHTGNYSFRFSWNTNPPQYLISPEFEGAMGMDVSFYYKNHSNTYPETFQVGYSTTTKSPSAFIWHDEVTADDESTWMLYEDYFPEGTKYVAVKLTSNDMFCLYLDDFNFSPAYCPPEDRCELTFELTDSYGDTWNGNAINVVDVETGAVLATMTNDYNNYEITGNYGTYTLVKTMQVCDGRELRFEWVKGNWAYECSYTITDANGTVILEGVGSNSMNTGDVLGTHTMSCFGVVQTIELTAGYNWVSFYVETGDPVELLDMLKTSLGDNGLSIEANGLGTIYDGVEWFGDLDYEGIYNEQMYLIEVNDDCTVELQGTPADPANYEFYIQPGYNWVGFPSSVEVSVVDALADFEAEEEDMIEGPDGVLYYWGEWQGEFETFVPGHGYFYYSNSTTPKTLVFQLGTKAK